MENKRKSVEEKLIAIEQRDGFLTENNVVDICIDSDLSIIETEKVCEQMISRNVMLINISDSQFMNNPQVKLFIKYLSKRYLKSECSKMIEVIYEIQSYLYNNTEEKVRFFQDEDTFKMVTLANRVTEYLNLYTGKRKVIKNSLDEYLKFKNIENHEIAVQQNIIKNDDVEVQKNISQNHDVGVKDHVSENGIEVKHNIIQNNIWVQENISRNNDVEIPSNRSQNTHIDIEKNISGNIVGDNNLDLMTNSFGIRTNDLTTLVYDLNIRTHKDFNENLFKRYIVWLKEDRFLEKVIIKYMALLNNINDFTILNYGLSIYNVHRIEDIKMNIKKINKEFNDTKYRAAIKYYILFLNEVEKTLILESLYV